MLSVIAVMTTKYASGDACWLQPDRDLRGAVSGSDIITEVTEVGVNVVTGVDIDLLIVIALVVVVEVVEVVVVVEDVVTVVVEVCDDLVVGVVDVTVTVTSVLLSLAERTVLVYSAWRRVWQSIARRDLTMASLTLCRPSSPVLRYIQALISLVELRHYCALIGRAQTLLCSHWSSSDITAHSLVKGLQSVEIFS